CQPRSGVRLRAVRPASLCPPCVRRWDRSRLPPACGLRPLSPARQLEPGVGVSSKREGLTAAGDRIVKAPPPPTLRSQLLQKLLLKTQAVKGSYCICADSQNEKIIIFRSLWTLLDLLGYA